MCCGDFCLIILSFIFPPLSALFKRGCGSDFVINCLLTILGYVPGLIHAWYLICKYPKEEYQILVDDSCHGGSHSHIVIVTSGLPPHQQPQPQQYYQPPPQPPHQSYQYAQQQQQPPSHPPPSYDSITKSISDYQDALTEIYKELKPDLQLWQLVGEWDKVLHYHLLYFEDFKELFELNPNLAKKTDIFDKLWQFVFYKPILICRKQLKRLEWVNQIDREIYEDIKRTFVSPAEKEKSYDSGETRTKRLELLQTRQELQSYMVEERWWRQNFHSLLDSASAFYYDIIQYCQERLEKSVWQSNIDLLRLESRDHSDNVRQTKLWLQFIQRGFHYVGDTERYRVQIPRALEAKYTPSDPKIWKSAQRCYERAISSNVLDGRSFHQIGILCSYQGDLLRVLVWYSFSHCFSPAHSGNKGIKENIYTAIRQYFYKSRQKYSE
ncbi:hypothetical protein H4219_001027 [Mycoemilia scoparia]|uniref:Telomerase activating protein Est1-like N-terminal domain-containing protein n=1 Tax=Mycoemilia scoparia TaxID=417184 RepID=A0A9W8DW01_9FUNG|nr:hypothetical protein H4219_001027 [Mycoemilia scoparia]